MRVPEEKEMLAYIAGVIDGDGSICITVGPRGKIVPRVQIHNSVKQLPVFLNNLFDGTVASDKPRKEGDRIIWKWMLQGEKGCSEFLTTILPYLVLKRDSAECILEFINNPTEGKNYRKISQDLNLTRKTEDCEFDNIDRKTTDDSFFWAYVAGLMDTDGSFSIERSVRKPDKKNRQTKNLLRFRTRIMLTMVADKSIKYILTNCEYGGVNIYKAKTTLRGLAFRYTISARKDAIEFLKRCIPFLQIKTVQAVKILNFCRNYTPTKGANVTPEEEINYREQCYREIIELNNTPS